MNVITGNSLILLGVRGDPGVVPLAMDIVSNRGKNPRSRMAAVMALVNSGSSALVPRLLEIAQADDPLNMNIVDLIGALTDETQLDLTLPVIIRTNATLSATYYHFRELKSRATVIAVLRFFLEHPNDLNSIRAKGYVEPILRLIPRYWDDEIAELLVDLIEFIETTHFYPDHNGPYRKLFSIVDEADVEGAISRLYFHRLVRRGEADRRRMHYVDQILAGLTRTPTARWLIEHDALTLIENLAPYLQGEVRELLRPHSNGAIDAQDAAANRYLEEQRETELARKTSIALVQERLLSRQTLADALVDFFELQREHWPELPAAFRTWLAGEISGQLGRMDLEHAIEWKDNSLWQPQILPFLLEIIDRYELQIIPDEPLVFAAMTMDRNIVANHYRRFGFSDRAKGTLRRLLDHAPSNHAIDELIRFVETAGIWSDEIFKSLQRAVQDPSDRGYGQVAALNLLMQHGADDDFVSQASRDGASATLRAAAFEGLISRQHRPTIERSLAILLNDEQELRRGEVRMPIRLRWTGSPRSAPTSLFRG